MQPANTKKTFFSFRRGLEKNDTLQYATRMERNKTIYLAQPHGMCAGVRRALEAVDAVLERFGPPVYVLHEIVHNSFIVNRLRERGVRFAETLEEVPPGAVLLFSAHGVSGAVEREARARRLRLVDATCPLVKRLHHAAANAAGALLLLGHRGHPEVEGTVGRSGARWTFMVGGADEIAGLPDFPADTPVALLAQTTLNTEDVRVLEEALKKKYPQLESAAAVCYATTNRQKAVRMLAERTDVVLVIGSPHSSNSNRLREVAEQAGAKAFLIEGAAGLPREALKKAESVGVGAGASAPESLVREVIAELGALGFGRVENVPAAEEETVFRQPTIPEKRP